MTRNLPVGGRLLATDPLLDAIAFSRGRFLVSGGGATRWPFQPGRKRREASKIAETEHHYKT